MQLQLAHVDGAAAGPRLSVESPRSPGGSSLSLSSMGRSLAAGLRSGFGHGGIGSTAVASRKRSLLDVPPPVLVGRLLACLDAVDLCRVACTNSQMQAAADNPRLWRRLLLLDFSAPRLRGPVLRAAALASEDVDVAMAASSPPIVVTAVAAARAGWPRPPPRPPVSPPLSVLLHEPAARDVEFANGQLVAPARAELEQEAPVSTLATVSSVSAPELDSVPEPHAGGREVLIDVAPVQTLEPGALLRPHHRRLTSGSLQLGGGGGAGAGAGAGAGGDNGDGDGDGDGGNSGGDLGGRSVWEEGGVRGSVEGVATLGRSEEAASGERGVRDFVSAASVSDVHDSSVEAWAKALGVVSDDDSGRAKRVYMRHMLEFGKRARRAAMERELGVQLAELRARRATYERYIRLLSLELTTPLLALSPLVSLSLLAAMLDRGGAVSPWAVLAPLLVLLLAIGVSILVGAVLLRQRDVPASDLFGLYSNFRGFVQFWMHKVLREQPRALACGLAIYTLICLWVVLVGLRLGSPALVPYWTAAFSPLWATLLLGGGAPLVGWGRKRAPVVPPEAAPAPTNSSSGGGGDNGDYNGSNNHNGNTPPALPVPRQEPYALALACTLLPVGVFCVLLPVWLDGWLDASLAVLLVPIWLLEGWFAGFPIVLFAVSLYTRKDVSDSLLVVLVILILFVPLLTFQGLLLSKVDDASSVKWGAVLSPLLLWFALWLIVAVNFLCQVERPAPVDVSDAHPLMLAKLELYVWGDLGRSPPPPRRPFDRRYSRRDVTNGSVQLAR